MPKHTVQMSEPKHDIINSDVDFWVWSDEKQMGHLHVSKGGVDWYSGKASVKKRSLSWEDLQALIERSVPETFALKPKKKRT